MAEELVGNNVLFICGEIVSEPRFSHEIYGEGFYLIDLKVPRLSDAYDLIPTLLSERLVTLEELTIGKIIQVEGQFRSYNNYDADGNKLMLTAFAREIVFIDSIQSVKNSNQILLNGFICKKPIYRTTPFGREITDILLAVNRQYNKSDYIPCISWGRNARFSSNFKVGDNILIWGRIQSRRYQKKLQNGNVIERTAYEVSVSKIEYSKESDK